ncbi:MAG: hypothetical protein H0U59_01495 [Gemmatimonadaceae bacterium]|nr:hypothetical protein [Gemmatimonadaceae bacterium]
MSGKSSVTLLRKSIDDSGMSIQRYSQDVLARNARTIHRWLSGHSPIPAAVVKFLRERAA